MDQSISEVDGKQDEKGNTEDKKREEQDETGKEQKTRKNKNHTVFL